MRSNSLYIILFDFKLLIVTSILLPVLVFSQSKKTGSIEYLKYSNGFNNIVLGDDIKQIPDYKLTYLDNDKKFDSDSCLKFAYRDTSLLKLNNDLYLELVGLRTYKNKVVNIYLFFKKKDGYKVLRSFLSSYGLFTSKPNDYVDIYSWNSSTINLTLKYELDAELGVAVFSCNSLEKEIEAMKIKRMINLFYLNKF
ncbi:MAG: hypothetical protein JWQ63_3096 [Mucilaginibacter sp.]|jgi:hypothetical protein|nr:hypothetical protein [Mucilaginibacter sp.]